MSSKSRTVSPFKFQKQHSLNSHSNGKLSGLSTASMPSFTSSTLSKISSRSGRSSTSGKRKAAGHRSSTSQMLQMSTNTSVGSTSPSTPTSELMDTLTSGSKENVTVTVRFRPLSSREIQKGDELAWYAESDTIVRSELCAATSYAFDRVFGPSSTTRHVYDAAAQHVVQGAMEGVNGTVFAYGVTSSGKTHTMHGDQNNPGIIPLAIKNVFSIIQETPGREFLLRVSYLEIYNEVINDLLNPAGQNLRVREDVQGTYVEGIKEEVVLSPAHCLSLIATGEEHRHVGSNNFNLLSSRSHTIFSLTIESSPGEHNFSDEEVSLSQLNLIDLAGSESSKTETTGLRRKEGSYINKSLLTLGTVISKLTDGKATHIPYRDSKLTRLLQSSLSGHGRLSLICTITPATSSNEETHNTLKFAHRAKQVEIHALPNKIMDEKSLIKKYQKEIQRLKHELQQLKKGMIENSQLKEVNKEDFATLKQQLEAGQVILQSRLEEEEQAKAALLGRIQRLTKLILVSTKSTTSQSLLERQNHRRRHSFGEEELPFLPDRRRGSIFYEDESELSSDRRSGNMFRDCLTKGETAWFKHKKNEHENSATSLDSDNSSNASSGTSGSQSVPGHDRKVRHSSIGRRGSEISPLESLDFTQPELFSVSVPCRKPTSPSRATVADQMDLLREQVKVLAGEVVFCTSSLKRLSEQAALNSEDSQIQMQVKTLKDELQEKRRNMRILEWHIIGNGEPAPNNAAILEFSQAAESKVLQHVIVALHEQLAAGREKYVQQDGAGAHAQATASVDSRGEINDMVINEEKFGNNGFSDKEPKSVILVKQERAYEAPELQLQFVKKILEIEKLELERDQLREERDALQAQSLKVAEEASYARELASAAAVELTNLAQEVTKLSFQNSKLIAELATAQERAYARAGSKMGPNGVFVALNASGRSEKHRTNMGKSEEMMFDDMRKELLASQEREAALEALIAEKELNEAEIWQKMEEGKRKEIDLENDLAGLWILVSKLKKGTNIDDLNGTDFQDVSELSKHSMNIESTGRGHRLEIERMPVTELKALEDCIEEERHQSAELKTLVSQLKSEDLEGLDLAALEDLSVLHVEALTRLCHAKARVQEKLKKNENRCFIMGAELCEDRNAHQCKVCFEAPTSAFILPCCHSLCRSCAVACTECPLCKHTIQDRIILSS